MDDGCYLTHVFAQVQMGGNSGMAKCRIVNALATIHSCRLASYLFSKIFYSALLTVMVFLQKKFCVEI